MKTDTIDISEKVECPSHKKLMDYARGILSQKEKHKIENHLISCEKCIAALQEVLQLKDASDADRIFSELSHSTIESNKTEKRNNKKTFGVLLFAALCILLLYVAYSRFFNHSRETKNDEYSHTSESPLPSSAVQTPASKENISPADRKEIKESVPQKEEAKEPSETKIITDKKTEEYQTQNIIAEDKPQSPEKPPEEKSITPPESNESAVPIAAYIKNYKISKSDQETSNYMNQLSAIFKKIDKSEYGEAMIEINIFLNEHPDDINGRFYRGSVYYMLENNDQALSDFEWLLNKRDNIFFEDARWYKILILNRATQFAEVRKMLKQIISENSTYSAKAKQLLELIGDK